MGAEVSILKEVNCYGAGLWCAVQYKQPLLLFGWKTVSSWLPSHVDVELSASSAVLFLPICCHDSCYDGSGLNISNSNPDPINYLPL